MPKTTKPIVIYRRLVRFTEVARKGEHLIVDAGPREPLPYAVVAFEISGSDIHSHFLARCESRELADCLLSCLEAD